MRARLLVPPAILLLGACYAPQAVQVPSYEPRAVAIPAECDALVQRAATAGPALSDADFRMVSFCQHQQLLRAQEEEAASRKLEAHARTAGVVLQAATLVLGATIAVLTWVF